MFNIWWWGGRFLVLIDFCGINIPTNVMSLNIYQFDVIALGVEQSSMHLILAS